MREPTLAGKSRYININPGPAPGNWSLDQLSLILDKAATCDEVLVLANLAASADVHRVTCEDFECRAMFFVNFKPEILLNFGDDLRVLELRNSTPLFTSAGCAGLQHVRLADLSMVPSQWESFVNFLRNLEDVKTLALDNVDISAAALRRLFDLINDGESMKGLCTLVLLPNTFHRQSPEVQKFRDLCWLKFIKIVY